MGRSSDRRSRTSSSKCSSPLSSSTMNREPLPSSLSAWMVPLWTRTISRARASPIPVPSWARDLDPSTWEKRSKIVSSMLAGMPMPVSSTVMVDGVVLVLDVDRDLAALVRELQGVGQEVEDDLLELVRVQGQLDGMGRVLESRAGSVFWSARGLTEASRGGMNSTRLTVLTLSRILPSSSLLRSRRLLMSLSSL